MPADTLTISLTGPLVDEIRAAAAACGMSAEDWALMKIEQRARSDLNALRHAARLARNPGDGD